MNVHRCLPFVARQALKLEAIRFNESIYIQTQTQSQGQIHILGLVHIHAGRRMHWEMEKQDVRMEWQRVVASPAGEELIVSTS